MASYKFHFPKEIHLRVKGFIKLLAHVDDGVYNLCDCVAFVVENSSISLKPDAPCHVNKKGIKTSPLFFHQFFFASLPPSYHVIWKKGGGGHVNTKFLFQMEFQTCLAKAQFMSR